MVRVTRPILDWVEVDLGLEFGFVDIKDWHNKTDEFNGVEETYAPTRLTSRANHLLHWVKVVGST